MEYLAAYHYELQTFTEKRETSWTYAALKSGYETCGSSGGGLVPPLPWEIEEEPIQAFKDEVRLIEVPHTESSKTCHRCRGTGKVSFFFVFFCFCVPPPGKVSSNSRQRCIG